MIAKSSTTHIVPHIGPQLMATPYVTTIQRAGCIFAALIISSGCATTREEYRDDIAGLSCDRAVECNKIGKGMVFENYDACMTQRRKEFDEIWPANQCTASIEPKQFDVCENKVKTMSCFSVDGAFTEYVDFLNQCSAEKVCTQ